MKATIEVKDRREAEAIRSGLNDPKLRAMVVIAGTLQNLPNKRDQQRVMEYIVEGLEYELKKTETGNGSAG